MIEKIFQKAVEELHDAENTLFVENWLNKYQRILCERNLVPVSALHADMLLDKDYPGLAPRVFETVWAPVNPRFIPYDYHNRQNSSGITAKVNGIWLSAEYLLKDTGILPMINEEFHNRSWKSYNFSILLRDEVFPNITVMMRLRGEL